MSAATHHGHDHDHSHNQNDRKRGPAKIATVEGRYGGDLFVRFRDIKGQIRTKVDDEDGFGLRDRVRRGRLVLQQEFAFPDDARKERAFMRWLDRQLDQGILVPVGDSALERGRHYTGQYVRQGYGRGVRHATRELRRRGIAADTADVRQVFNLPIHRDQLRALYRRQFRGLNGITDATGHEISRVLSEGLAAGENPRNIAGTLTGVVDDVGIKRARTLARTEISRSYNSASAKRYQQFGVEQVDIVVSDPCPICQDLKAGAPYPVTAAAGILPAHPNCVCSLAPVVN